MPREKLCKHIKNDAGGYDLLVERDAGNPIRILTGNGDNSAGFWEKLLDVCEDVLADLNAI